MDQRAGTGQMRAPLLASLMAPLLALLLVSCDGAKRQQQQAAELRQRQLTALLSRCRSQQATVRQQVESLASSNARLSRLSLQTYIPLQRPLAPDPELLARFTREDQELELERHGQALERWRQADRAGKRRWQEQQQARRRALTAGREQALAELSRLGVAPTADARSAWSSCDQAQLEALKPAQAGLVLKRGR